jgi:hypothetical protein
MKRSLLVGAILSWGAAACSGGPAPEARERTGASASPIQDGADDSSHTFVVGILQHISSQEAAFCTGALLAPNLVATARHCVSTLPSAQIDCATSTFGPTAATNLLFVTTAAVIDGSSTFLSVDSIIVPTGANEDKVCGNDIALLILRQNVQLPQYVTPAITPPMTDHQIYSTNVTAIGYGVNTPTDTKGNSAGTRRIKENVGLLCIPGDTSFTDCFSNPQAPSVMTAKEFISGDASTCEGDSGSSAFEQTNFSNGRWLSFGLLSRGGVSSDMMTCIEPIYTRFDSWPALLMSAAAQAAAAGKYKAPPWAGGPPAATYGAAAAGLLGPTGFADGIACNLDTDCNSNNCVSTDNVHFVCASTCTSSCASGFICDQGYCFSSSTPGVVSGSLPASSPASPSRQAALEKGGCSLSPSPTSPAVPWTAVLSAGCFGAALARRRRRRGEHQLSGFGHRSARRALEILVFPRAGRRARNLLE